MLDVPSVCKTPGEITADVCPGKILRISTTAVYKRKQWRTHAASNEVEQNINNIGGEYLLDFILNKHIEPLNKGSKPTNN